MARRLMLMMALLLLLLCSHTYRTHTQHCMYGNPATVAIAASFLLLIKEVLGGKRTRTGLGQEEPPTHTACLFLVVYASPSYRHHYQPSWSCSPSPPILSFVDFLVLLLYFTHECFSHTHID